MCTRSQPDVVGPVVVEPMLPQTRLWSANGADGTAASNPGGVADNDRVREIGLGIGVDVDTSAAIPYHRVVDQIWAGASIDVHAGALARRIVADHDRIRNMLGTAARSQTSLAQ